MVAERQLAIVGMAGITLDQYAECIGSQLSLYRGVSTVVQMAHRSDLSELLQDLADSSQPRFGELKHLEEGASSPTVATVVTASHAPVSGSALAQSLAPLSSSEQRARTESAVLEVVRELTGADGASVGAETPLMEAGVDSLAATELSSRLRSMSGVSLSPTIVFDQPTPRAIAAHLLEQLVGMAASPVMSAAAPMVARLESGASLSVEGAVGNWPGGCSGEEARWLMQAACGDAMSGVPASRWVLAAMVDPSTLTAVQQACVQHGGFVSGADRFDCVSFGISPAEAHAMDPQQRLLLELGYASLHASSHRRVTLMGGDSGVFLGIERPDWSIARPATFGTRLSLRCDGRQCVRHGRSRIVRAWSAGSMLEC